MKSVGNITDPEVERLLNELAGAIARSAVEDGDCATAIDRLTLHRRSAPSPPLPTVYWPGLALVAQGAKAFNLAEERYVYDRGTYLLVSVELPVSSHVIESSSEAPYLCAYLGLDPGLIGRLMIDSGLPKPRKADAGRGVAVRPVGAPLLDAVVRLVRLLESPGDIEALVPLVVREIHYRLLRGESGGHLRQMALDNSRTQRVTRAIAWLKEHFAEPVLLEELASEVNMSASGFHHYFKAVTALTPLQYQKQLRLQEARRLMLSEDLTAATAGFRVGYESPTQFTREYRRLFGAPPHRDITRLRSAGS
jgi:AraC-like DNA-binding protein